MKKQNNKRIMMTSENQCNYMNISKISMKITKYNNFLVI